LLFYLVNICIEIPNIKQVPFSEDHWFDSALSQERLGESKCATEIIRGIRNAEQTGGDTGGGENARNGFS
jgi:hypothetical protein